ncbi:MAG TPA: hypothetical protein VHD36_01630 [Pirellulales bacterium]|nr:hypothetical protein [Lacipirellulaceae bacterium]HVU85989.1 hypothetical protein [Pirellulales bacterium]
MSGIRIFQLLEPLMAGSSAKARLLNWNGERYTSSAFATVTVHDFVGEHGSAGDRGYCYLSDDSHRWEVLGTLADHGIHRREQNAAAGKDEREDGARENRRPLFPALGQGSHDDWPSSALM